jgi:hypothetical protein
LLTFLQLRPDFGGASDPSFLVADRPRKAGGEVGGGAGTGLHSMDGRDLPAELEEFCELVARVESERATEVMTL